MHLFGKKTHPVLEAKLKELEMDMSNNYKDNAQDDFHQFMASVQELDAAGKLNDRQRNYYGSRIDELREILKGYTHKDQKATW